MESGRVYQKSFSAAQAHWTCYVMLPSSPPISVQEEGQETLNPKLRACMRAKLQALLGPAAIHLDTLKSLSPEERMNPQPHSLNHSLPKTATKTSKGNCIAWEFWHRGLGSLSGAGLG